jgi:hypothetical protein
VEGLSQGVGISGGLQQHCRFRWPDPFQGRRRLLAAQWFSVVGARVPLVISVSAGGTVSGSLSAASRLLSHCGNGRLFPPRVGRQDWVWRGWQQCNHGKYIVTRFAFTNSGSEASPARFATAMGTRPAEQSISVARLPLDTTHGRLWRADSSGQFSASGTRAASVCPPGRTRGASAR